MGASAFAGRCIRSENERYRNGRTMTLRDVYLEMCVE